MVFSSFIRSCKDNLFRVGMYARMIGTSRSGILRVSRRWILVGVDSIISASIYLYPVVDLYLHHCMFIRMSG